MTTEPVLRPFRGLSAPQLALLTDTASKTVLFLGGKGSGKTLGGAWAAVTRAGINPPGTDGLVVAPRYGHLVNPILPALLEVLAFRRIRHVLNRSDWCLTLPGNRRIWLRSASNPASFAGINAAWGWIDEAAFTEPDAQKEMVARLRKEVPGVPMCRQLIITSTHKGRRTWVYAMENANDPTTHVIRATSYDNPGNPSDWLEDMERTYRDDPAGHAQEIRGIAMDKSGTVYTNFKERHLRPCPHPGAGQIAVGWDFNNHVMPTPLATWFPESSVIHIWGEVVTQGDAQTEPHAQAVIRALKKRVAVSEVYEAGKLKLVDASGRPVLAFIDASANHKRTTPVTDKQLIAAAGFSIRSADSNPRHVDRIKSVQFAFAHDRLFIDEKAAPMTARAFREHDYDQYGEPRKSTGSGEEFQPDHFCDAGGYLVSGLVPIGHRTYKPQIDDGRVRQRSVQRMVFGL